MPDRRRHTESWFCGGCLGFEDGFGFGFCGGRGGEGANGGGFVAAGCWGGWVLVMVCGFVLWVWPWVCGLWSWVMGGLGLQWVSGLTLGLDCGGFSGGSFDFVVFLMEGLILSAVVLFCRREVWWKKKRVWPCGLSVCLLGKHGKKINILIRK